VPEEIIDGVFSVQVDDVDALELADAVRTVFRLDELC